MTRTDRRRAAIPAEEYAARYVDVPRFLACCRACPHFGANWSCPPLAAEPPAVWSRYRYLEITGLAVYPGGTGRRSGRVPGALPGPASG